MASRSRAVIHPLLPVLLGSTSRKDMEGAAVCPEKGTRLVRVLEHKHCEEQLRELGLFVVGKRRLRGDLITLYNS